MPFQIVIPTRDSAKWVLQFLAAYREIGAEPLYLVDARSTDATETLLRTAGARIEMVRMDSNFVEGGMIEAASRTAKQDWVLRIDDDELPSRQLLLWARETGCQASVQGWMLSRRELMRDGDGISYSRLRSHYHTPQKPRFLNAQLRLYRHKEVDYIREIHTPGFKARSIDFAPQEAYFIHCDALVRSAGERIEKLRRYEKDCPGSSWRFCYNNLPELSPRSDHDPARLETEEFDRFLASLPMPPETQDIALSEDELAMLRGHTEAFNRALDAGQRRFKMMERGGFTNKRLAGLLCTLAGALKPWETYLPVRLRLAETIHQLGSDMWYCAELREQRAANGQT